MSDQQQQNDREALSTLLKNCDPRGYTWVEKTILELSSQDDGALVSAINEVLLNARRAVSKRFAVFL